MSGAAARKVGSEIDIAWFMPRLSFSVLSLYPIPSNRPPLPTPVETSVLSLSLSPSPAVSPPLHPSNRAISIPLGLAPLALAPSLLSLSIRGRQPATTEPNFNEDCASESTASIGETLVSLPAIPPPRSDRISAWKSSRALEKGIALSNVCLPLSIGFFLFFVLVRVRGPSRSNSDENELRKSWTNRGYIRS